MRTLRFALALLPLFPKHTGLMIQSIWLFATSGFDHRFKVFYIRGVIALLLFRRCYRLFCSEWQRTSRSSVDFSKFLEAQRVAPNVVVNGGPLRIATEARRFRPVRSTYSWAQVSNETPL